LPDPISHGKGEDRIPFYLISRWWLLYHCGKNWITGFGRFR